MTPAKSVLSICLAAGFFLAGYMANRQAVPVSSDSARQVINYTCPMHPQYKSDHSGTCPVCGMSLVATSAGGAGTALDSTTSDSPAMVRISTEKQQLIGARTDEVKKSSVAHLLRVPGRIVVDEQRLYRITAGADGWVRELGRNSAGTFVKKDQVLASYYAPNLLSAAQTFVFASLQTKAQEERKEASARTQQPGPTAYGLLAALDSLRNLGMSESQIQEIRQTGAAPSQINLYAPISGFVIARNLSPEQRFDKGTELYRIADISHVWVLTDIFEKDSEFVKPGAIAVVRYQGREFPAHMSDTLPQFDAQSRTLKTRFELDNPGYVLRPDMFVDVELHVELPNALTVPADAVIDSGSRKTVYVERGNGMFEPRLIETGWRLGDRVQITKGLEPGERIVVSSNFLVDSESRMRLSEASASPMAAKAAVEKDVVCGMEVDPRAAEPIRTQCGGKTWYFCSPKCRKDFEADPGNYVHETMAAQDTNGARSHQ